MASPLFQPPSPQSSPIFRFLARINATYSPNPALASYADLHAWSIAHLAPFWTAVWDETHVLGHKGTHVVDETAAPSEFGPPWFSDARLNWAENILRCRARDKVALVQVTEPLPTPSSPNPAPITATYAQLYALVADLVSALLSLRLSPGDRVASYSSNCIENVAACLAATAIGCIWVSAAADFGPEGVLERLDQVQPKVIFSVDGVVYNGKVHPHLPKLTRVLSGLRSSPFSSEQEPKVIIITTGVLPLHNQKGWDNDWVAWDAFVEHGRKEKLGISSEGEIQWYHGAFDWPLWILFSSGTTGRPKPIVHRAGGMLLQSLKELLICADLSPGDVFFYYTTTGWMMWNFLVGGLASGCTLVLYDGSPLRDPAFLWRLVDELGITIFGTSAKYLDQLSKGYNPREHHSLSTLRHVYSTGSPLSPALFDFVYQHICPNVLLASITGGTDICSLFAGMCTALPVYRGEIQCRMLGMAVEAFTPTGTPCAPGEEGELVCTRPFPVMPLGFWPLVGFGDAEAVEVARLRYKQAYFDEFAGVWYHGDHVVITPSRQGNGGGLVMLGRSDGVLNPGGVRFGSSEIYDVVDACFSSPATSTDGAAVITDCLAVGQKTEQGMDERVVLFVKLRDGQHLSPDFEKRIKAEVRARRSARHVPGRVIQVTDIPYTLNGKRVEVPVKKIINGTPASALNAATLRNAECLAEYEAIGMALRAEVGM